MLLRSLGLRINQVSWLNRLFTPAALFAAAEPGVWYDPSDFNTLYQDSAGTTPVTATGQPVGLILDKSQGLALGAELAGAVSVPFTVFRDATTNTPSSTLFSAVVGETYLVVLNISANSSTVSASWRVNGSSANITAANITGATGTGQKTYRLTALASGNITIAGDGAGVNFTVSSITAKKIAGNHASQSTSASRPVLNQDANGKYYLAFDGVDDSLATGTINPGSVDKAQVFAGVKKISDTAAAVLAEYSSVSSANAGAFGFFAPSGASSNYTWQSRGSALSQSIYTNAAVAAPVTSVLTGIADIVGDLTALRVNGTQVATAATDQGTGNYLSYPLYIGRRGGSTLPFNGQLYGLIVRFGANLDSTTIGKVETYLNSKTGAF